LGVMKNPWLDIPLADYEGHMALPNVGQAQLLSDVFASALSKYKSRVQSRFSDAQEAMDLIEFRAK